MRAYMENNQKTIKEEHILVCLSSSPSNARIIRTAADMAKAYGARLTALYVRTPSSERMTPENLERLQNHIRLAEDMGAELTTVYGEDIAAQIIEFSRLAGITKLILGKSPALGSPLYQKQTLTDKILKDAPELDIHIIPDAEHKPSYRVHRMSSPLSPPTAKQWGLTLLMLLLSTVMGFLFHVLNFTDANTITVYILGVLITALIAKNHICNALFSLASVLLFNFFFTDPGLSFAAYETGYPVTFIIMFSVSLITGMLVNKITLSAKLSANAAYRTSIMLETNQLLQKADSEDAIIETLSEQVRKLLNCNIIIYPVDQNGLREPKCFPTSEESGCKALFSPQEKAIALQVLESRKRAGAFTERHPDSLCQYLAVRTSEEVFLVIGIQIGEKNIEPFENSILISILGECALATENLRNAKEKERVALLAKNEQLRANLLRAISHDLRTPLTSISGNAENLLANFEKIDEETRKKLLSDVSEDAKWLISLVENLLSVSRISEGRMNIRMSAQLVDEVIAEALQHIGRKTSEHTIMTDCGDELLLAKMDARLISQVIINLVDNAIKYTPKGSVIRISAANIGDRIAVSVADNGPGIPDERKADVFRMFYIGERKVTDCRRSLGLGLALCQSIVTSHGGKLTLSDNKPNGCNFTFTLQKSEVDLNE